VGGADKYIETVRNHRAVIRTGRIRGMLQLASKENAVVIPYPGGKYNGVAQRAQHELPARPQSLQRGIHVRVRGAGCAHHVPEQLLRVDRRRRRRRRSGGPLPLVLGELVPVFSPERCVLELGLEGGEELVVQGAFAPLDPLPGAGGRCPRYAEVYPAYRDAVGEFVVENGLERGKYLPGGVLEGAEREVVWSEGEGLRTQTPPMSKRRVFGGVVGGIVNVPIGGLMGRVLCW